MYTLYSDPVTTVSPHGAVLLESVNIIELLVSRGWADASARCLQVILSCAALCQTVSLQYCLHCRRFSWHGLQVVTRELHRSSLKRLMCHAQDHTTDFVYQFCPLSLTQMLLLLFLNVVLSICLLSSRAY